MVSSLIIESFRKYSETKNLPDCSYISFCIQFIYLTFYMMPNSYWTFIVPNPLFKGDSKVPQNHNSQPISVSMDRKLVDCFGSVAPYSPLVPYWLYYDG